MVFPVMKHGTGTVSGRYQFGRYTAMLVRDPESVGPIKYLYMLILTERSSSKPVLVVTCERNEMQHALIDAIKEQLDDATRRAIADASPTFLCFFDGNGAHHNDGALEERLDDDVFLKRAFALAADKLGVSECPVLVGSARSGTTPEPPGRTGGRGKVVFGLSAIALALVILFPPYTEFFASPQIGTISGHGGWKFVLEIGQYNTRQSTEGINVVLWVIEALFVLAAGTLLLRFVRGK